jgi:hypothetical protein
MLDAAGKREGQDTVTDEAARKYAENIKGIYRTLSANPALKVALETTVAARERPASEGIVNLAQSILQEPEYHALEALIRFAFENRRAAGFPFRDDAAELLAFAVESAGNEHYISLLVWLERQELMSKRGRAAMSIFQSWVSQAGLDLDRYPRLKARAETLLT